MYIVNLINRRVLSMVIMHTVELVRTLSICLQIRLISNVAGDDRDRKLVKGRETLLALKELFDIGKSKAFGLSNELMFCVYQLLKVDDTIGIPLVWRFRRYGRQSRMRSVR